nr:lycopene beta-cyclase CrtY [uncultured Enterobacter sp.]
MKDLILVGAGLANGLIALRLKQRWPALDVTLLEAGAAAGGNHTWSFHHDDVTDAQRAWLTPLVAHVWGGYDVRFPAFTRRLPGAYYAITSERFAQVLAQEMGERLRLNTPVAAVSPEQVTLASGEVLRARAVIDGRGMESDAALRVGYQVFVGQQWLLDKPHGLTVPILMDATVTQQQGYRFVYTLPLTPDSLLIEDTRYADTPAFSPPALRQTLREYAAQQQWRLKTLQREESGCLPITLSGDIHAFWQRSPGQPRAGLRAGLFHATTGYSLPLAVRLADSIADSLPLDAASLYALTRSQSLCQWRQQRFFRLLNRMLFLAGRPEDRWQVMQRFYRLPEATIARFYAGAPSFGDKARILIGKPPVPPGEALRAALNTPTLMRGNK